MNVKLKFNSAYLLIVFFFGRRWKVVQEIFLQTVQELNYLENYLLKKLSFILDNTLKDYFLPLQCFFSLSTCIFVNIFKKQ